MSQMQTMHEVEEFHPLVRSENPSVDQNASSTFDLIGLPFVPKHLIFRYLDMKSLNVIRQTGHSMNNFVLSQRHRLVSYGLILNMVIECVPDKDCQDRPVKRRRISHSEYIPGNDANNRENVQRTTCEVVLYNRKMNTTDIIRPSERLIPDAKWKVETERGRSSFFRGFADRFCNAHIVFSFDEVEMDHLEELWKKRKLRMDELILKDTDFFRTSAATVLRFINIVRPPVISILGDTKHVKDLLTAELYKLVPSLEFLYVEPELGDIGLQGAFPISPAVNTLPQLFHLAGERRFPIGVLKNALHSWWRNEMTKIDFWRLNLDDEYVDPEVFVKAIDLPYEIIKSGPEFHRVTFSRGGRSLRVMLGFLEGVAACEIKPC